MINILVYFIVGLLQDIVITRGTQTIFEEKEWPASTLSFINTMMSGTVYLTLFAHYGESLPNLIAYAAGGGLGVWGTIKFRKRRKNGNNKKYPKVN
jgi:uncharacterized protein YebE (UPF0316 family)